jgi:hypothetical protein
MRGWEVIAQSCKFCLKATWGGSTFCSRTVHESKGLEFDDVGPAEHEVSCISNSMQVLLYNFFEDSTASASQWQPVMNGGSGGTPAPDFNETRNGIICTEVLPLLHPRPHPLTTRLVEVPISCDHTRPEEPLDFR